MITSNNILTSALSILIIVGSYDQVNPTPDALSLLPIITTLIVNTSAILYSAISRS